MPRLNINIDDETYYEIKRIALDNDMSISEFVIEGLNGTIDAYICANGKFKRLSLDSIQMDKKKWRLQLKDLGRIY